MMGRLAAIAHSRLWPIASFRGNAAISVAFEAKRTFGEPRLQGRIFEYAP